MYHNFYMVKIGYGTTIYLIATQTFVPLAVYSPIINEGSFAMTAYRMQVLCSILSVNILYPHPFPVVAQDKVLRILQKRGLLFSFSFCSYSMYLTYR